MGRRGFESRLFTCQKLIQRNESQSIILDVDMLSALTAGLIRCIHIDSFYQLMKDVRGKLLDTYLLAGFLNELLNVLNLCFLYFDFFLQTDDLSFQFFLFRFIGLTHHIKALIAQLAACVILINLDE